MDAAFGWWGAGEGGRRRVPGTQGPEWASAGQTATGWQGPRGAFFAILGVRFPSERLPLLPLF